MVKIHSWFIPDEKDGVWFLEVAQHKCVPYTCSLNSINAA